MTRHRQRAVAARRVGWATRAVQVCAATIAIKAVADGAVVVAVLAAAALAALTIQAVSLAGIRTTADGHHQQVQAAWRTATDAGRDVTAGPDGTGVDLVVAGPDDLIVVVIDDGSAAANRAAVRHAATLTEIHDAGAVALLLSSRPARPARPGVAARTATLGDFLHGRAARPPSPAD